jgi:hypothetical protein
MSIIILKLKTKNKQNTNPLLGLIGSGSVGTARLPPQIRPKIRAKLSHRRKLSAIGTLCDNIIYMHKFIFVRLLLTKQDI